MHLGQPHAGSVPSGSRGRSLPAKGTRSCHRVPPSTGTPHFGTPFPTAATVPTLWYPPPPPPGRAMPSPCRTSGAWKIPVEHLIPGGNFTKGVRMLVEKAREESVAPSGGGQTLVSHVSLTQTPIKPSSHLLLPPCLSNFGCFVVSAVPTPAAHTEVAVLVLNCCQRHWRIPGTPHPISWQRVPCSTPSSTPAPALLVWELLTLSGDGGCPCSPHQGLSWSCPGSQSWEWSGLTESTQEKAHISG